MMNSGKTVVISLVAFSAVIFSAGGGGWGSMPQWGEDHKMGDMGGHHQMMSSDWKMPTDWSQGGMHSMPADWSMGDMGGSQESTPAPVSYSAPVDMPAQMPAPESAPALAQQAGAANVAVINGDNNVVTQVAGAATVASATTSDDEQMSSDDWGNSDDWGSKDSSWKSDDDSWGNKDDSDCDHSSDKWGDRGHDDSDKWSQNDHKNWGYEHASYSESDCDHPECPPSDCQRNDDCE